MKVTNVKGVLVATVALDPRDFGDISSLSDAELVLRAKQAVSTVIPAHLNAIFWLGGREMCSRLPSPCEEPCMIYGPQRRSFRRRA